MEGNVLPDDVNDPKGLLNLNNIVLQPDIVENAYKNPDSSLTYLVRWKSIWLHESLCINFTDLINDYWQRHQNEQFNKGQQQEQQCPIETLNENEVFVQPIMQHNKQLSELVGESTIADSLDNDVIPSVLCKNASLLDGTTLNDDSEKNVFKQIVINIPCTMSENFAVNRQVFQALGNQSISNLNISVSVTEDDVSSDANVNVVRKQDSTRTNESLVARDDLPKKKCSPVSCEICDKVLSSRNSLREHRIAVHLKNGKFACDQCEKRFAHQRALKIHKVMHTNERKFVCDECGSSHKRERELRRHKEDMHSKTQNYRCDVCFTCFKAKGDLKSHCFTEHKTTVTNCIVCKQKLSTPFSIYSHSLHHSQIKEYKCDQCGKGMTSKGALRNHILTHDPNRKPYKTCPKCGKDIYSRSHYYEHVQSHDEITAKIIKYRCEKCDGTFQHSSSLKRHMLRHRPGGDLEHPKINPYATMKESDLPKLCCRKCRKLYTSTSGYYDHIKKCRDGVVMEERCQLCAKTYASRRTLNRHFRQAHSTELEISVLPAEEEIEEEVEPEDAFVQVIALAPASEQVEDIINETLKERNKIISQPANNATAVTS